MSKDMEQNIAGLQPYYNQPELFMNSGSQINNKGQNIPVDSPESPVDYRMEPAQQQLFDDDDEIELGEYEIVRPEFFAHIKEPAFTINVDKISVNTACVRLLPDTEFIQILINRQEKKLVLLPCDETEITGYRWVKIKNGKRYSTQRSGEPFVLTLCRIMDWNPDYRYKILGRLVHSKGRTLIAFDMSSYECFPKRISEDGKKVSSRRSAFTSGDWDGRFGPKYAESRRSLQMETFNGFTVISIKGKEVQGKTISDGSILK